MTEYIVAHVFSMAATFAVAATGLYAATLYLGRAGEYERLMARVPDACRLENLRGQVLQVSEELSGLRAELAESRYTIAEKERAERWLDENRDVLHRVEAERKYQEALRLELEDLQQKVEGGTQQYKQLRQDMDAAEIRGNLLKHQMKDLEELLTRRKDQERLLDEAIQKLESRRAPLEAQVELMERALASSRQDLESVEHDQRTASKGLEDRRRQLEDVRCEHARLSAELAGLSEYRKEAEKTVGFLGHQEKELLDLIAARKGQIQELDESIRTLESEAALLDRRLASARQDFEMAERDRSSVVEQLEDHRGQLEEVRREHAQLTAEVAGLSEYRKEIDKTVQQIKERLADARESAGEDDRLRIAELWQPALSMGSEVEDVRDKEETCLETTQAYLEGLGLRFHDRVLRAFHTSLKVADESPLVVLAGISGTGKSELPRRYAEAMGIHFLNIAVQPRWDSPQDMFGFYNYLEGRYRATELARALVQMDPYHGEEGRGWLKPADGDWRSLSDQMLLVLLDEMNLARVEYYFSELLSRLETRRGVGLDDPQDRAKAEIALEVGLRAVAGTNGRAGPSVVSASPTMRLFVGTNVLFVGTMNEDESTQALSDKVIDRSNLMRFGKPSRLFDETPAMAPAKGRPHHTARRVIRYETWRGWVKDAGELSGGVGQEVDRWITGLNDATGLIQRPFAHRTYRAIRAYVANYPGAGSDAHRHAMADQVEQKIMPKFRGLDLHEPAVKQAINRVIDVVKELDDEALIRTVDEARRNKDQLFAWQGVDRTE